MSIYPNFFMSVYLYQSSHVCLSVCLSLFMSVYLCYVYISFSLFISNFCLHPSPPIYLSILLLSHSINLFIYKFSLYLSQSIHIQVLFISLTLCLVISIYPSVHVFVFIYDYILSQHKKLIVINLISICILLQL